MKSGDKLLEKLRKAAKRRDDIALIVFALPYEPDWLWWLDYARVNKN